MKDRSDVLTGSGGCEKSSSRIFGQISVFLESFGRCTVDAAIAVAESGSDECANESLQLNKGRDGWWWAVLQGWKKAVFGNMFDVLVEGKSLIKDDTKVLNIRWVSTAEMSIKKLWVDDLMRDLGMKIMTSDWSQ